MEACVFLLLSQLETKKKGPVDYGRHTCLAIRHSLSPFSDRDVTQFFLLSTQTAPIDTRKKGRAIDAGKRETGQAKETEGAECGGFLLPAGCGTASLVLLVRAKPLESGDASQHTDVDEERERSSNKESEFSSRKQIHLAVVFVAAGLLAVPRSRRSEIPVAEDGVTYKLRLTLLLDRKLLPSSDRMSFLICSFSFAVAQEEILKPFCKHN